MGAKQAQPAAPAAPPPTVKIVEDTPTPEAEPTPEVVILRRQAAELQQGVEVLQRKLERKNDQIAELEEQVRTQAKEIGRLTVAATVAGATVATKGLTQEEFEAARARGVVHFLVLEPKELWDGSHFERGLGIDARQWPKIGLYIHHGLALAPMPETGG